MKHTKQSLDLVQFISEQINDQTFHHHYHILYDILLPENPVYLEIGCYAGGSSCLMVQKPNITVIAVDLGQPINESVAKSNVTKLNQLNNEFHYIKANSHLEETVDRVKRIADSVDLLFIDGDHTYYGVLTDFKLWAPLVKPGGYIVFDDYNDHVYSPEVRVAVDEIVRNTTEYDLIGTLENIYGARPADLLEGNCYIIRKIGFNHVNKNSNNTSNV